MSRIDSSDILSILKDHPAGATKLAICEELQALYDRRVREARPDVRPELVQTILSSLEFEGRLQRTSCGHINGARWSLPAGVEGEVRGSHDSETVAPGADRHGQSPEESSPNVDEAASPAVIIGADLTNEGWAFLATEITDGRVRHLTSEEAIEIWLACRKPLRSGDAPEPITAGSQAQPSSGATQGDQNISAVSEPAAAPAAMLSCEAAARLQALARELAAGQSFEPADTLLVALMAEMSPDLGGAAELLHFFRDR